MTKKGSITVFLTLILSLLLSLLCTSVESARMAAARTQILNGLDIGLYSLFGQYDKALLEKYDLFVLDGSCGRDSLDMASVYDNFEKYMKPVLRQNSQKLKLVQGGFSGYRLLTDNDGEVFYRQVTRYMKDTLGSHGVQLLIQKMKGREEETRQAQERGEQAENGGSLQSYDSEMNAAAQNSQAAQEEAQAGAQGGEAGFGDGQSGGQGNGGQTEVTSPKPQEVVNPITIIRRIRKMGILELVLPAGKGVSDKAVSKSEMVSGRQLQQGMAMEEAASDQGSYTSQVLFQQYMMEKLGNYQNPGTGGLRYQTEYVLGGRSSDLDNLKAAARKLLLIREGVNFAHLMSDPGKYTQAQSLAIAIAAGFLIPPASGVIQTALLLCWAFAESVLDVRELFDGGKIPLVKTAADWQLSLENLPNLLEGLDSARKHPGSGMSYEDYLQVMLLTTGRTEKVKRTMDMIEQSVRAGGRESFRLDSCITAIEASVEVRANTRKVFTAARQYCYD